MLIRARILTWHSRAISVIGRRLACAVGLPHLLVNFLIVRFPHLTRNALPTTNYALGFPFGSAPERDRVKSSRSLVVSLLLYRSDLMDNGNVILGPSRPSHSLDDRWADR
jgi:hypothetical protein